MWSQAARSRNGSAARSAVASASAAPVSPVARSAAIRASRHSLRISSSDRASVSDRTQVEIEAVSHGSETSDGVEVTSTGLAGFLIKRGIHRNADIQFGTSQLFRVTDFEFNRTLHPGEIDVSDNTGPGDLQIRLKWNLWGNDGGKTAFALMPFVDLPTSRDSPGGAVEGGLIAPLAIEGPIAFGFGVMGEVDWFDVQGERWTEWMATATTSHDIVGGLGAFVEFAATFRLPDEGEWLGLFNTGATLAITPNIQLDGGSYEGVV